MVYTINFILYGSTIGNGTKNLASLLLLLLLFLLLLLLLIVVYDGDSRYNETIFMDWYVDDDDGGICQPTC